MAASTQSNGSVSEDDLHLHVLSANEASEGKASSSGDEISPHGQASQDTSSKARKQSETETTKSKNLQLKRKFGGAYKYKTKFQKSWTKTWPFVSSVPSDDHKFRCNVCAKVLVGLSWL